MSDAREVPILFSGPMVRAILDGRKTETRRILKPQPPAECSINFDLGDEAWLPEEQRTPRRRHFEAWSGPLFSNKPENYLCGIHTWKYRWCVGDRLWVRETWGCPQADHPKAVGGRKPSEGDRLVFAANDADAYQWQTGHPGCADFVWRPSIHMPRWASRITLEVTAVRVERLQKIDEAGAIAEGCPRPAGPILGSVVTERDNARRAYRELWDTINGPGYWDANPWVTVTTFRRIANAPAIGGADG